jgi:excisionase family DNA binding protein
VPECAFVYRRGGLTADPRNVMQNHEKEDRKFASRTSRPVPFVQSLSRLTQSCLNVRPRHKLEASGGERIKDCRFIGGVRAVAPVPTCSSVMLIDGKQQPFPRPVSNPFVHCCRIRSSGSELFHNLTDRQGRCSQHWRANREWRSGETMPPRSSRPTAITIENGAALADERSSQSLQRTLHGRAQYSDVRRRRSSSGLPKYYSIKAVAEALDVSPRTVRRWIENRDLIMHRVHGVVRIAEDDLRTFLMWWTVPAPDNELR